MKEIKKGGIANITRGFEDLTPETLRMAIADIDGNPDHWFRPEVSKDRLQGQLRRLLEQGTMNAHLQ